MVYLDLSWGVQENTSIWSPLLSSRYRHNTAQHSTVQQYRTVDCSAVQCSRVDCSAVQYSRVDCSAVQYSTVDCSTVQYSRVDCSAVQ